MNIFNFFIILTGVLLNAVAQLCLKAGTNNIGEIKLGESALLPTILKVAFEPYIIGGLTCYVFSVAIWIVALSKVDVSVAYPMLSIGYVVNVLAAYYLFGEAITDLKAVGIMSIILGVYLVARS